MKLEPAQWTADAVQALTPALDGASIADFNDCDLWKCGACYVVTQSLEDDTVLHVWLVGGEGFHLAADAINQHLHDNEYRCARFRTRDPAALRMYGPLNPELINAEMHEYRVWPYSNPLR